MKMTEWEKWAKKKTNQEITELQGSLLIILQEIEHMDKIDTTITKEFSLGYLKTLSNILWCL